MSFQMFSQNVASVVRGFAILGLLGGWSELCVAAAVQDMSNYTWVVVYAGLFAVVAAYGIGANDVANAFASSVGSKALTMRQAVVAAVVFEFLGAVLLGGHVSETIRKGIADTRCFDDNPALLMWGMTCVLQAVAFWLILASYLEMPVSTTHSVVGAIIGMTMMCRSPNCVIWYQATDTFPYMSGVAAIVLSWVLSPVASAIVAAILYLITYSCVLRWRENSFLNAQIFFPFVVAFTVGLNVAFFIVKGASGQQETLGTQTMVADAKDGDVSKVLQVASIAAAIAFAMTAVVVPCLKERIEQDIAAKNAKEERGDEPIQELELAASAPTSGSDSVQVADPGHWCGKLMSCVTKELDTDPYDALNTSNVVESIHDHVQRHDVKTEEMFKYIQVFTAVVDSFSHGANDVANAMGPFAAVYIIYKNGFVTEKEDVGLDMFWILALGGLGIGLGLATYGYKIMVAIGVKLTAITPSRGSCIELGAAFVIIFGTTQGWPLSTTHCQVGATVGVGMFEGRGGVNWVLLLKCVAGWALTLVVAGGTAALLVGPSPDPVRSAYCS